MSDSGPRYRPEVRVAAQSLGSRRSHGSPGSDLSDVSDLSDLRDPRDPSDWEHRYERFAIRSCSLSRYPRLSGRRTPERNTTE
jgi:hypothetical protein